MQREGRLLLQGGMTKLALETHLQTHGPAHACFACLRIWRCEEGKLNVLRGCF